METVVRVIQVTAPLITVGLAVYGFFVWYWQLAAKRKFEIAEQAITVWRRAIDALKYVRSPFVTGGEGNTIALDEKMSGNARANAKAHRYIIERLNYIGDAFKDVRVTQILVDLHIAPEAARAFDVLFRVRHLVRVDNQMLIEDFEEYFQSPEAEKEYKERRKGYRQGIVERRDKDGKPMVEDVYSRVLDEATEVLESECRVILRGKKPRDFFLPSPAMPAPHDWSDEAKKVLGIRS